MSPVRAALIATAVMLAVPAPAFAAAGMEFDIPSTVSAITGAGSLVLAGMLLLVIVQVRRVAEGSAVADHVSYVAGASLCLVASVLLRWVDRFVGPQSVAYVRAGADVLTMVSFLLFAVYFSRLKRSLDKFLSHLHSDDALAEANGADGEEEALA